MTSNGSSVRLYHFDLKLRMYLPVGTAEVSLANAELDTQVKCPKDIGGLKFIAIKGKKNRYVSAHDVAVETA